MTICPCILRQELCPLLVSLLGSPKTDKNIVSSQKSCEVSDVGRGSGCLAAAPSCQSVEAKTINRYYLPELTKQLIMFAQNFYTCESKYSFYVCLKQQ